MKYFSTFLFAHHPSTDKARGRKRTRVTARTKQLNELKTEMLPIYIDGAFFFARLPIPFNPIKKKLEITKTICIFVSRK